MKTNTEKAFYAVDDIVVVVFVRNE